MSSVRLFLCDEVYCGETIHPTAKVSDQVNRKCPPSEYDFTTFNPLHRPYHVKLPRNFTYYVSLSWSQDHFVCVATNIGEYCYRGDH